MFTVGSYALPLIAVVGGIGLAFHLVGLEIAFGVLMGLEAAAIAYAHWHYHKSTGRWWFPRDRGGTRHPPSE